MIPAHWEGSGVVIVTINIRLNKNCPYTLERTVSRQRHTGIRRSEESELEVGRIRPRELSRQKSGKSGRVTIGIKSMEEKML